MDASDAREQIEMVDSILRTADRSVRMPPSILIAIGAVCTLVTALIQARQLGLPIPPDPYIQPPAFLLMMLVMGVTAWRGRHAGRTTLVDADAGRVFLIAAAVGMTLNVTAQHRVISPEGMGLIWAAAFSMALLIVGAIGSRPLFVGGLAMLAATALAGIARPWLPGLLAVGWFVGFVVPGLFLAAVKPRGRTAAV